VRQGCILSSTIFNVFLSFDGFEGMVSISGRSITNLHFADHIHLVAGKVEELIDLISRIVENAKRFSMQFSAEKSKAMRMGTTEDVAVTISGKYRTR